jgi:hypothetical protein
MQLTTPTTVVHLGNAAREQRMSVDLESLADIIRPLTDLYSDRILAFVREYSTNAWDSHLQAGVTEPIQVGLPTRTDLFWTVQDFGLGLSADELADLYSVYGKSRNRGSDVAAGMYGFGSKSALAYADDFSIISVKDGIRNVVQVVKDNDGIGVLKFLDQRVTTDRNGVTVKVPVRLQDVVDVRMTSENFYKYWDLGTVEVEGVAPASVWEDTGTNGQALILDPDVYVTRARWGNVEHKIVMGQVAYPVPANVMPVKGWSVVARVPMGAVFPTPSREALKVNDQTVLDTLADLGTFVNDRIVASVRERLEAAKSPWERFKVWHQATSDWEVSLPDEFNMRADRAHVYGREEALGWSYNHGSRKSSAVYTPLATLLRHGDDLVIHSFPLKALTPVAKARIANYCDSLGRRRSALVLTHRPEVLDGHPNAIAYADLPEIKRERGERVVSQGYKWKVYKADGTAENYEAPSPRGGLVSWYDTTGVWPSGMVHTPGVHVASLRKNQVDKFQRTFPHARSWHQVWADAAKAARAGTTMDDAIYAAIQASYKFGSAYPNYQSIQDPDLRKVMEVATRYRKQVPASYTRAHALNVRLSSFDLDGILNRYPLITRWHGDEAEDAVLYINTKYIRTKNNAQEAS